MLKTKPCKIPNNPGAFASTPKQVELVKRELSALVFGPSDTKNIFI